MIHQPVGEEGHDECQTEDVSVGDPHAGCVGDGSDEERTEEEGRAADRIDHGDTHARVDALLLPRQAIDDRHKARDAQTGDEETDGGADEVRVGDDGEDAERGEQTEQNADDLDDALSYIEDGMNALNDIIANN